MSLEKLSNIKISFYNLLIIFFCLFFFISCSKNKIKIPEIDSKAPYFQVKSNADKIINFPNDNRGYWTILFSFPTAFGTVCSTELKGFVENKDFFDQNNTKLIGVTFDDEKNVQKCIEKLKNESEYAKIFPIISDKKRIIAKKYGMYQPKMSKIKSTRSIIFIDPDFNIKSILIYPLYNGRNIEEIKRLLLALQLTRKTNKVTPVNWQDGAEAFDCHKCMQK